MSEQNKSQQLSKEEVAAFVKAAVQEAVAVGMAVNKAQQTAVASGKMPADALVGQCAVCHQRLIACKALHRKAVVFPQNPRYADPRRGGWVGVQLNNVTYRSNGPGHEVQVPADFYPENIVAQWEATEDTMSQGRVGGSNLGQIGNGSAMMNPFANMQAWR